MSKVLDKLEELLNDTFGMKSSYLDTKLDKIDKNVYFGPFGKHEDYVDESYKPYNHRSDWKWDKPEKPSKPWGSNDDDKWTDIHDEDYKDRLEKIYELQDELENKTSSDKVKREIARIKDEEFVEAERERKREEEKRKREEEKAKKDLLKKQAEEERKLAEEELKRKQEEEAQKISEQIPSVPFLRKQE